MNQEQFVALEKVINKDYSNIAGIVVLKDGQTLYEHYFNGCSDTSRIHVYSVTKSIVSLLIGIALDKGCIKSLDQKVLSFFPDYLVKKGERTIQKITLENLMTMTAPYKYKHVVPYVKYFTSDDSVTFTLDLLGGRGQIGKFRYTPLIGPDILSGILVKSTGQSVFDFATENVFSPLGITVKSNVTFHSKEEQFAFNKAKDISGWVADSTGVNTGGWGLTLSAMDMAKIGQLYLDGGMWNGKQIVSVKWINESIKEHSRWEKLNLSYGYLWWLIDEKEHACAAMGDGGNVIYFNTQKKIIISIASTFVKNAKDRLELIKEHIEPIFED
ncbi:penicillin-binding protein, beta-lactamase class C [Sphaerochaeta pleomorpha str. Grapes]|uniref:Penicillin-binding protein, beta-lactamase class C n=1 Tax=Sphaerochaeta pleomorpha (strain ATCC BAA-1885 / DSM 22778 / Grapes) TaxID=158190 RepID=G8QSZ0_SPHPG|nr:serine hydrolase [Sphaerochaeta pleomorpha]AEV30172.1 penicillin-binding protein, beta-lactamase class C [Sphaerochaeta pleomorpha str. Grapes]